MVEIIAIASSVAGLGTALLTISGRINSFKNIPHEARAISAEVEALMAVNLSLQIALDSDGARPDQHWFNTLQLVMRRCRETTAALEKCIESSSKKMGLWRKIKWTMNRNENSMFVTQLRSCSQMLGLLLTQQNGQRLEIMLAEVLSILGGNATPRSINQTAQQTVTATAVETPPPYEVHCPPNMHLIRKLQITSFSEDLHLYVPGASGEMRSYGIYGTLLLLKTEAGDAAVLQYVPQPTTLRPDPIRSDSIRKWSLCSFTSAEEKSQDDSDRDYDSILDEEQPRERIIRIVVDRRQLSYGVKQRHLEIKCLPADTSNQNFNGFIEDVNNVVSNLPKDGAKGNDWT